MNLFKRKPKEETVSRAEERLRDVLNEVEGLRVLLSEARKGNRVWEETAAHFCRQRNEARVEADANRHDALKYRARLKRDREYHANRRQSRDKQQAEVGA